MSKIKDEPNLINLSTTCHIFPPNLIFFLRLACSNQNVWIWKDVGVQQIQKLNYQSEVSIRFQQKNKIGGKNETYCVFKLRYNWETNKIFKLYKLLWANCSSTFKNCKPCLLIKVNKLCQFTNNFHLNFCLHKVYELNNKNIFKFIVNMIGSPAEHNYGNNCTNKCSKWTAQRIGIYYFYVD